MLAKIMHENNMSSGFLFHDSHIFDGVDTYQICSALNIASELAKEIGIQYILTMNSDIFASLVNTIKEDNQIEFNLKDHVIKELSDIDEGRLFGNINWYDFY